MKERKGCLGMSFGCLIWTLIIFILGVLFWQFLPIILLFVAAYI